MKKTIIVLLVISSVALTGFLFLRFQRIAEKQPVIAQKLTILLDWFPNTNHTGLYVAQNKGYFAQAGLDITVLQQGEGDSIQLVASGKTDFAVSSQESVIQARAKNIPVVSIAAILQHNTSAFASLEKSNIKTVNDFEDKRYGGWGSPIEEAVLTAVMSDAGADYKKVKNITIGTTDFFTSIGRDSDFQWIFYGWDGIEAQRRGIALNTIMLKDLNPVLDYYTPVIITNEQHIKEQKDVTTRFMHALAEGYAFATAHPDKSVQILLKSAPELNAELVVASQAWLSPAYQAEALQWGVQKPEVWQRYAQWLYDRKLIDRLVTPEESFTNEFLPKQ